MADVIQVYTDGEGQETGRMEYMGDYVNPEYLEETIYHETLSYNNIIQNGHLLNDLININTLMNKLVKYNDAEKILSECKKDYEYVSRIIDDFC